MHNRDMQAFEPPFPGSRMVDRDAVDGRIQDWPARTLRYISRSWRGPVHIQMEGVDFNLRYVALHDHQGHGRYPRHHHPHSELLMTLDGEGLVFAGAAAEPEICSTREILVLPPRKSHHSQWSLAPRDSWRLLVVDFDLALDLARLPLENENADLAFAPFYEWFYARSQPRLELELEGRKEIEPILVEMVHVLGRPGYGVGAELIAGVLRMIAAISRDLRRRNLADGRHAATPLFSRQGALLKARTLMEHRGWFDPGCVGRLAREVGMAETHFIREFHAAYGLTPKKYAQQVLMRRASALLKGTDLTVAAIAERLGYEEPSIFSRAFRRAVGLSPDHYRRAP